jgi:hypothetical protein
MSSTTNNDPDKLEFQALDYERLENEYLSFKLEDGTIVKVKVDFNRVGKAVNYTNPDGTPHYLIDTRVNLSIIPSDRKFSIDKTNYKGKKSPPGQMFK